MLLTTLSLFGLLGWLGLALCNGRFWLPLTDDGEVPPPATWPSVDIVVPARNEAESLPEALSALLDQNYPGPWRVVLIDDHSSDGTADVARSLAQKAGKTDRLTVLQAPDLQPGWKGKVAAMQTGVATGASDYILFTDADIRHAPFSLQRLVSRALHGGSDLTSLMVLLRCSSFAEKLMIPAFVFFFAMLYPFRHANDPTSSVAAAAGGVMLVRRATLERSGGLAAIKNALIDDCSLARTIKQAGGRLCLTLTRDVTSLRPYPRFADLHAMVARTAFTQLRLSWFLLLVSVMGLGLLFFAPFAGLAAAQPVAALCGALALGIMGLIYAPTVRFYGLPAPWALSLPFAAIFYIVATISSALSHARGRGGQWKNRAQA